MQFESRTFWLPKDFESPHLYEDATALKPERGRAAIGDGVTSGIFCAEWAQILTSSIVEEPPPAEDPPAFLAWLGKRRQEWKSQLTGRKIEYFERPKIPDGAMTTMLWFTIADEPADPENDDGARTARAYAAGDCCLFQYRDGARVASFPMTDSSAFGLLPTVLRSIDRYGQDPNLQLQTAELQCRPGDLIVLCTDAVGLWAFNQLESGEEVDWNRYWTITDDAWREEVHSLRSAGAMRVDDSTLVLLRLTSDKPADAPATDDAQDNPSWIAEPVTEAPPAAVEATAAAAASDEQLVALGEPLPDDAVPAAEAARENEAEPDGGDTLHPYDSAADTHHSNGQSDDRPPTPDSSDDALKI